MNEIKTELKEAGTISNKIQTLTKIVVIGFVLLFSMEIASFYKTDKIKRKIDHRYFNITNSLQDIHHVEIETLHGRILK